MLNELRQLGGRFRQELRVYRLVLHDHRTPKLAKILLGMAVGYVLLPFDIIPDCIPVIGYLDDVIIVPVLVIMAMRLVPTEVIEDCRVAVFASEL